MVYRFDVRPVLNYLANFVPLDGAVDQIWALDQTPDGGVNHKGPTSGRRCHTENFPTKMQWHGPADPETIGDFNRSNLLNVSNAAKAAIEHLEPGIHQFVPFEVADKRDVTLDERFFWIIGNRLDSVDRKETTFVLRKGLAWRSPASLLRKGEADLIPAGLDLNDEPKFVFSTSQIGSAHVWRDKHIDIGGPFASPAFADAVREHGLTGLGLVEAGGLI